MRGEGRRACAWLGVLLLVGALACGGTPSEGAGHGIVEDVDPARRTVTLDHGKIPGLMGAMTMTFEVAPGVALDGVEPGATVDFRLKLEDGSYTVTELRPTDR